MACRQVPAVDPPPYFVGRMTVMLPDVSSTMYNSCSIILTNRSSIRCLAFALLYV